MGSFLVKACSILSKYLAMYRGVGFEKMEIKVKNIRAWFLLIKCGQRDPAISSFSVEI